VEQRDIEEIMIIIIIIKTHKAYTAVVPHYQIYRI